MTHARKLHFVSNAYRHTLRVGDEVILLSDDSPIKIGTICHIDNRISIKWSGEADIDDGALTLSSTSEKLSQRTPTFRMKDLTDEEQVEIVTLRISGGAHDV